MSSNWVDGDRFFDRETELRLLRERMARGTHTLLTAQRRMGKTSLVRELLRRLDEEGETATVFVDLEGAMDAGNWQRTGDQLFEALASNDRPVVLAIDELPILVNRLLKGHEYCITSERRAATDSFMGWLRKNCQTHQGAVTLIISGSVGLEPVLKQAGLRQAGLSAHGNVYVPFDLRPWTQETAAECLAALARGLEVNIPGSVAHEM